MRASRLLAFALVAIALPACGPGRASTTPPVKAPSAAAAAPEEEPPDLTPVAIPSGLLVVGRWREPAATADTLFSWAKLPIDWRALITRGEGGVGSIVAVKAPVELAVVMPDSVGGRLPEAQFAFSIGLSSLDSALSFARAQGEEVQRLAPGVFRVGGDSGIECAAAASVGAAPARLVCGSDFDDVEQLLPFMTRGLPSLDLGASDVHIELRIEPLRPVVRDLRQRGLAVALNELSIDDPRFDRALAEAARGGLDELMTLAEDADRLSLDVELDRPRGVATLGLGVSFRGQKSWALQTLLDMQRSASPPPESFWRLPADASQASYAVPFDPKRTAGIRRTLADLLESGLAQGLVPRRTRDELTALVDDVFALTSGRVSASGSVPRDTSLAPEVEKVRQLVGWHLVGFESEPATRLVADLDRIVSVYNDPQLRKWLAQRRVLSDLTTLPKLSGRPLPELAPKARLYELSLPSALVSRGGRAQATGARPAPASTVSVFVAVIPAGQGSFLGLSADRKLLVEKLRSLEKAKPSDTLAQRAGLEELRQTRALAGGFTTLRVFAESVGDELGIPEDRLIRALDATQGKGNTPILTRATLRQERGTELVLSARATQGTVLDLASVLPALFAGGLLGGLMND